MSIRAAAAVPVLFATIAFSTESRAALTSSEKAQLRDFVASARIENAGRVRTLVARTDHTEAESIAALVEAVAPVPWTPERAAFVKEVVFGGASAASRPLLAVATTNAALARADSVYQKYTGGLDHEPRAISELVSIYSFLDAEIANAPKQAGIPVASYEAASKAMRDHVEKNPRWLKGDGAIAETGGRVRAQAQVLLFDLLPEGTTRKVDAADRLGLKGSRRQILSDWGILLADAGKIDEAKAAAIRNVLARLPGAREGVELLFAGEDRGGQLRARGTIAYVGASGGEAYPFDNDVSPGTFDASTSAVALDLSVMAARRALDKNLELRKQSEADAIAAGLDPKKALGRPRGPGVDHIIGAAIHLLVTDPARAIDLAFMRHIDGRRESAAILSDALGALAVGSPSQLDLAKPFTALKLAPTGAAVGFTFDGKPWAIDRGGANGAVTKITRDGAAVTLGHLPSARTPTHEGMSWSEGGYTFTKMRGGPQVGLVAGADKGGVNVKLVGTGAKGYDAAGTIPNEQDYVVEGDVKVTGGPGGLAFRAVQGRDAVRGAVLVFIPGAGGRTMLATSDDAGAESLVGQPIDPTPTMPVHVKITVKGTSVEAVVGTTTIKGTLPATLAKGEVAVIAKKGATVEVTGFAIKKK
jgi:hypothetical protein